MVAHPINAGSNRCLCGMVSCSGSPLDLAYAKGLFGEASARHLGLDPKLKWVIMRCRLQKKEQSEQSDPGEDAKKASDELEELD